MTSGNDKNKRKKPEYQLGDLIAVDLVGFVEAVEYSYDGTPNYKVKSDSGVGICIKENIMVHAIPDYIEPGDDDLIPADDKVSP